LYGRDIFNVGGGQYLVFYNEYGLALYDHNKKEYTELDARDTHGVFLLLRRMSHPTIGC
jgi:hypothetical protein